MYNNTRHKYGFTLIEVMVASSIFIIVMVMAVGAIFTLVSANRKSQALASVVSNLNISLESMVRDIRTGSDYSIPNNGRSISFTNQNGDSTTYSLNQSTNALHKSVNGGVDGDITAPEVQINTLSFTGTGTASGDTTQSLVLMQIKGTAGVGKYSSPFTIQTLLAERLPED